MSARRISAGPLRGRGGGDQPPGEMWAAVWRPRGFLLPQGALSMQDAPPIFFSVLRKRKRAVHGPKEKAAWTRSGAVALRADGSRRIGACADFTLLSGTLSSSAVPVVADPWRMARKLSGWLSHCLCASFRCRWPGGQRESVQRADALIDPPVQAPTTARGVRSEAERAERGAGQMRPCTPAQDAPAPRESAVKSAPHPAAPVGEPSQSRRHHLSSTPVQRGGTKVPERDRTGRGAFSF